MKGEFHLLVKDAMMFDEEFFFQMFRMSPTKFQELLCQVAPLITRVNAKREPISADERLCVTLRFLVTGDAFNTIGASYRMSGTTVGRIVKETCSVLWKILAKNYLKVPSTQREWVAIAEDFESKWNFNNCVGAIDGKHVTIQCPPRGGSMYYNYKKFHSIVLMATVNACYQFIMVDIGDYGRLCDASVFANSKLGYAINNNLLNLPNDRQLEGTNMYYPYVFVGDDAFPLKKCLMKPYPGKNLSIAQITTNYRISRARRIVENAFGIASSRFRVFRKAINASVKTATEVTKAVVVLHNFLMTGRNFENHYCPIDYVDQEENGHIREGSWRREHNNYGLQDIRQMGSNNYARDAKEVRDNFCEYFNSEQGSVPWQTAMVNQTSDNFDE